MEQALAEDVGTGDVTTDATVAEEAHARAGIVQKAPGAIYGLDAAEAVFTQLDPDARCERLVRRGRVARGRPGAEGGGECPRAADGGADGAELPRAPVGRGDDLRARRARGEGTGARVLDTRKTTPGMRALEKAAVAAGGASNHRAGLYDAMLIKENHIAAAGGIAQAIDRARAAAPELAGTLEVEVRNPRGDRRSARRQGAEAAAGQHGRRAAARRGRPGGGPRGAGGERRSDVWRRSGRARRPG